MIDLVVAQLKTGTWKNVVPFGSTTPAVPYLVVREEPTELGYTRWRITGHALPNQILQLRTYIRKDVVKLLDKVALSGSGRYTKLDAMRGGQYTPFSVVSDDGTISMEAVFQQFVAP